MKKRLFNLIFKKEIDFYLKKIAEQYQEIAQKNREIKKIKEMIEDEHDLINNIGSSVFENKIIAVDKNKLNRTIFVVKNEYGSSLDLELYDTFYKLKHVTPKIECIKHKDSNYIEIADFHSIDEHIKNGYILMKNLIEYAKLKKFDYLKGDLAPVDSDDFDYLEKYYERFGFIVTYLDNNNKKLGGKIKLNLNK